MIKIIYTLLLAAVISCTEKEITPAHDPLFDGSVVRVDIGNNTIVPMIDRQTYERWLKKYPRAKIVKRKKIISKP